MDINNKKRDKIIADLIEISISAGQTIRNIYNSDFKSSTKSDGTPLTLADTESNKIICDSLAKINKDIPIISEENGSIPYRERSKWGTYWLVDPLDGTKEFMNKNGEFTTNIALINNHKPIIGVVHSPITKKTFIGHDGLGSFCVNESNDFRKLNREENTEKRNKICRVAVSRSHKSDALSEFLNQIGDYEEIESGSSIKFCMLAENKADIYPRLGPTSEWDTAAGHAVALYAGCYIESSRGQLEYNKKESYLNDSFIVTNKNFKRLIDVFKSAALRK